MGMCVPYTSMSEPQHLGKSLVCITALWRIWHFRSICLLLGRYDELPMYVMGKVLLVLLVLFHLHPLAWRHCQVGCHSMALRSISICPSISVLFSAVFGAHVDTCSPRGGTWPKPSQTKPNRAKPKAGCQRKDARSQKARELEC